MKDLENMVSQSKLMFISLFVLKQLVINTAVFIARHASRLNEKGSIIHLVSKNIGFCAIATGIMLPFPTASSKSI